MRFLMQVNIPVEAGNAAAKAGKLGHTIHTIWQISSRKPFISPTTMANALATSFLKFRMPPKYRQFQSHSSSHSKRTLRYILS